MKNKKAISLLLALVMAFASMISVNMFAFAAGITYTYDAESATLTISGTGKMTDYTENTLADRPWNAYSSSTKKVIISKGVTSVGAYAFSRFSALSEVSIPSSVTTLGDAAFAANNSLLEITIPNTVTTIGDSAFGTNYEAQVPENFVAYVGAKSAAQAFCFKNYIPFDCPMTGDRVQAVITAPGEHLLWSFVAPDNGTLTFFSTGGKDTIGYLYDADDYFYSNDLVKTKASAKKYSDDVGSDVNFKVIYNVEKGHRYYLAANYSLYNRYQGDAVGSDGIIVVNKTFVCTDHKNFTQTVITPSTCAVAGTATYTCNTCGYSYQGPMDKTEDHKPAAKVVENRVEPECEVDGSYDDVVYCSVCEKELSRTTNSIDMLGHSFTVSVSRVEATCTDDASETFKCERCEATNTVVEENSALGHNYETRVIDPTCEDMGYTIYSCTRCTSRLQGNFTEPTGHTPAEAVEENRIEATCEIDGSYDSVVYCDECEEELERTSQVIKALGHHFAITAFVDGVATVACDRAECENTYDVTFMDYYNTAVAEDEGAILDVTSDGFINAKDFAKLRAMFK